MKNNTLFEINNLNLWYGEHKALENINLSIEAHTVTSFIGSSGCGKSTFLRVLNRMNDLIDGVLIKGSVLFEGNDIFSQVDVLDLRRRVGMVFQKPNPFPMSIYDNVAYGMRLHAHYKKSQLDEIVETALKQASLFDEVKDRLSTNACSLSGGQQQRLCIARTLAVKPHVILMDEPTSALDPISTAKIEELIIDLKKTYSIVIVTHNMQQASRISDYTSFFHINDNRCGYLVEHGPTKEIFSQPRSSKTKNYIEGKFG